MQQNNGSSAARIAAKEKMESIQWTDEEELRLLRAVLEIAREPVESFDATVSPVERVRRAVGEKFPPEEIVGRTKKLRKKYEEMCRLRLLHSRGEAQRDVFGAAFEISDQIWGLHGSNNDTEKEKQRKGKEKLVE